MTRLFASLVAAAALLSTTPALASAPEPAKPVDLGHYVGKWYEVARLHNMLEDGCVGATADYVRDPSGRLSAVETCLHANGAPPRVWRAGVKVLDPPRNAKLRLTFFPFVFRDYWVLDHADDYDWAIVGTSNGRYLWLFSRRPDATPAERAAMVERARALGYDTAKLIQDR